MATCGVENVHSFFRASVVEFRLFTPERGSLARSYYRGMDEAGRMRDGVKWKTLMGNGNIGFFGLLRNGISKQNLLMKEFMGIKRVSSFFSSKLALS
jgi:hypothetical protein